MIGIVTHYEVHNHGAQLQLFALINILKEKGCSVKALTFRKDYRYMESFATNKYFITFRSVPYYLKYFLKNGIKKTFFNIKKKNIFDKFRAQNSILGCSYEDFDGELLIIGSDEVFSTEIGLTDAFWGVNSKCKNIVSYAASFGPTTMEQIGKKKENEYISAALGNFCKISVRDMNSYNIIENLTNKKPVLVCDPVILYGYKIEINSVKIKVPKQKYILLYSYDNNMNSSNEIKMIRSVANHFNMPVFSIGFYHYWCDRNINASPIELLGYFKNAEYVITDTFHGSVISLITESEFTVFVRNNSNKLCNLLDEYNLASRIFETDIECIKNFESHINYDDVNSLMLKYKKNSQQFLDSVIGIIV